MISSPSTQSSNEIQENLPDHSKYSSALIWIDLFEHYHIIRQGMCWTNTTPSHPLYYHTNYSQEMKLGPISAQTLLSSVETHIAPPSQYGSSPLPVS